MAKKEKDVKFSFWAAHLVTVVSVAMLLVLVGAIALLGITAVNTARDVKQQQQVSLIMNDSVGNREATALAETVKGQPYVHTVRVISKEQALKDWNESTGDDVAAVAGYNFFTPEVEIHLSAAYTSPDSLAVLTPRLQSMPGVDEVVVPDTDMISAMDRFFSRTLLILGCVALAMIVISFVLINNTVLLTIYSRRFTIHTMQLVGATPGFIRKPFVAGNMLAGAVSGLAAALILAGALTLVESHQMPELAQYLPLWQTTSVLAALPIAGALLCALASLLATNRYLNKNYDDLFT